MIIDRAKILRSFSKFDTSELHAIWERNDRTEYSDDAFGVIEEILKDRGEEFRCQQDPVLPESHSSLTVSPTRLV